MLRRKRVVSHTWKPRHRDRTGWLRMQSDAKRSRGRIFPAICDLQGDFQKLQGEPILLPASFLMVSMGSREFSRLRSREHFLVLQGKEQGAFFGIAGKSSGVGICEWLARVGVRGASWAERAPDLPRSRRLGILQSADRHRRRRAWVNPRPSCPRHRRLVAAGNHRPPPLPCRRAQGTTL
jgi:hypothetical protein